MIGESKEFVEIKVKIMVPRSLSGQPKKREDVDVL